MRQDSLDIEDCFQRLAIHILKQSLDDYKEENYKEEIKRWIDRKGEKFGGFYWCLEYSKVSPNIVRKYIKCIDDNEENKNS